MPRRELRSVSTERIYGAVVANPDGSFDFQRGAADVFKNLRRLVADDELGTQLMADGWSNGYLYLSEVIP